MIVNAIYHGLREVHKVYRNGEIIFQRNPIAFHVIEDGKLIILGAMSAISTEKGLYLDCEPEIEEWDEPVQDGTALTITQAYTISQNGTALEVE